jgi:carboxypeptidase family protein
MKKSVLLFFVAMLTLAGVAETAGAQTAATGAVLGTVTDPGGAVAPGVAVELTNTATNKTLSTETNSSGQYVFANVTPGVYALKFMKSGFSTGTISNIQVNVNKTLTYDLKLEISKGKEVIEVVGTAQAELQTADAQVGNEVSSDAMLKLPTLRRNAAALLTLQPAVSPGNGSFPRVGMRVAGAVDDQNVFTVDGIDVSDNVIGGIDAQTIASIPLGVESIEEYRVGVNNPNATFGRASGGQIGAVSKSGTNSFHGAGYWFHQNSYFNATEWELNRIGKANPKFHDNRFGGKVGGPIWKNKAFFFFDYEGRRFPSASIFNRLMPTPSLRAGILKFKDANGNIVSYDLKTSTLCGAGGTACDPRGLGISPSVAGLWGLDPQGTDASNGADGLNTLNFTGTAVTPLSTNFYDGRIDYEITKKWHFNGSYLYYQTLQTSGGQNAQYDLRGASPKATSTNPTDRDAIITGLTGQITPNLINTFRFGWVRDRESFNRLAPSATAALEAIPGTDSSAGFIALAPALAAATTNALVDAPIEVDTQRARFQNIIGRNIQYVDDVSWIKSTHTIQFGGNIRHIPTVHVRNDKVVGSLASLEVLADADVSTFLSSIPGSERPPTCGAGVTNNCLQSGDVQRWDRLYASALGLVDNIGILTTRDGGLNPLPFGTPLINDTTLNAFEFYGQDSWRIKPNLTLTYGLSYGWQTPPHEKLNRQTLVVDAATLEPLTGPGYIGAKMAAALAGQTFNPTLGFQPVKAAHRTVFNTDYGNVAPRVAVAWTPNFNSGLLQALTGDRKTVVRGGYSIVYDRENTVQTVIIPMLGVGFAQTITVGGPLCNASGTPGTGCNSAAGVANPGAASFRVGVDGTLPLPTVPPVSQPVVPGPFGELFSFQDDPNVKVGRSHAYDFTIQRQLPGNMILEVGWVGRWADRLPQGVNFNSAPYFFADQASKQTFAQAYDAVAAALAAGTTPAAQPFFENQLPFAAIQALGGGCAQNVAGATNTTQFLANAAQATFTSGLVNSLFSRMDGLRTCLGLPNYQNQQLFDLHMRTYIGKSNYNGLIATLRKRTSHGFTFDASYTFSKTLDQNISNQNQAGIYSNSYHPNVDYGPSLFDRRHIFNFNFLYELPFGAGHRYGNGAGLNRLVGGWYTSGIYSAFSGLPLFVTESSQVWGGGSIFGFAVGQIPLVNPNTFDSGVHNGVDGSNGIGTASTGLNLFSDPAAVFGEFRNVEISKDGRSGRANPIIGLGFWNLDVSVGKKTAITERVSMSFSADFFNIFNHPNFQDPTLNISSRASFGVISAQLVPTNRDTAGARWIQLGLRFEF